MTTQESATCSDRHEPPLFENALAELQQVVHDLEEGHLGLEASLARFEMGIALLRSCYKILESAEQKIEILTGTDAAGNPVVAPFDAAATFGQSEKIARKPGRRRAAAKPEPPVPEPPAADGGDTAESRLF